jgi:predicted membrane protein
MSTTFDRSRTTINPDRVIAGVALMALGALLLLQQMGYRVAGDIIGSWWPVVIVAIGAAHFAASRATRIGPFIVLLIGIVLLARTLDFLPGPLLGLVWPVILLGIGLSILVHRTSTPEVRSTSGNENHLELSAAFSGITHVSHAPQFQHARLSAFFGGIVLDLRSATLDPTGATIDVSATCGGAEIRVPLGWRVEMSGAPVFGGYESEALEAEMLPPDAPQLQVNVTAVCGGVSVKH